MKFNKKILVIVCNVVLLNIANQCFASTNDNTKLYSKNGENYIDKIYSVEQNEENQFIENIENEIQIDGNKYIYTNKNIENTDTIDKKDIETIKKITLKTNNRQKIIDELGKTMEYNENGYIGTYTLDIDTIKIEPHNNGYYDKLIDTTESATKWAEIFEELKTRGVDDIFFVSMDGLTGLPDAIEKIYPNAIMQRCIVHIDRNIYSIVPKKDYKEVMHDFKKIYTATNLSNAKSEYENFKDKYKNNKKLMKKVDDNIHWIYQIFEYPVAIRKAIYTTNSIESLNSALRKVTKGKGSFINEEALLKVLFLRVKDLQEKWSKGVANWKNINLELIEIFGDRYLKYIVQ